MVRYVGLSGFQLLRFSQTPVPRLQKVDLDHVSGPSNRELFEFLSGIASTLEHLMIKDCDIPRPGDGEEYALDAVVHSLSVIERLDIKGDYVSALVIARKTARDTRKGHIWIENAPGIECGGVVDALGASAGWGEVSVTLSRLLSAADEALKGAAMGMAQAKGIVLMLLQPISY